jgi:enoyl-CoA hydratase
MWQRLGEIMKGLDDDDDVRCVVLNGAGNNFSGGADIGAFASERADAVGAVSYGDAEMSGILGIASCRHPVVASINGACVGGGLEIAVACDIRVCGKGSRFGVPVGKLGLTMSYEEVEFMTAAVGKRVALELLLEGNIIGSERALQLGLVTHVVEDEDVPVKAKEVVQGILGGAPLVHRWHKKFFRRIGEGTPLTQEERREGFAAFDTEDFQAGYQAFLEKRKPDFNGQ